jgi:galactokinase/mevalonate kinase-like predicted kinase
LVRIRIHSAAPLRIPFVGGGISIDEVGTAE